MYDDEQDQTDQTLPADAVGEEEAPEMTGGDDPGPTDFVKAAVKGAKNLKDLKNLEP